MAFEPDKLRRLRLKAGWTQAELARRAGLHRIEVVRLESGQRNPRLATLEALASALGRALTSLLDEPQARRTR